MKRARKRKTRFDDGVGFQIAPMIDVVFVIMLFFMVMAGAVKVEKELNSKLPGTAENSSSSDVPDEAIIHVAETGEVTLNDEPMDSPTSKDLPTLRATLLKAKQASASSKTPLVVTIISEPEARYSRTVDVLDALATAQIEDVSFTTADEE